MVLIKKRTLFVQNVCVDTWIAIFSKLSKNCHQTFKQDLLQTRIWEKINKFPKAVCSQELWTSGLLNCSFEDLTKMFLPIFRNKHLHKPETNMIFLKWLLCREDFPLEFLEIFWKIWPKTFRSQFEKRSVSKLFFSKQIFFLEKVP